jgi:hypothetical protein
MVKIVQATAFLRAIFRIWASHIFLRKGCWIMSVGIQCPGVLGSNIRI